MENKVIFRDNQELPATDLLNSEQWTQDAIDHVVGDTIIEGSLYAGFAIAKTAATQFTVQPGRLYTPTGAVYANPDVTTLDIYNDRPVSQQRYFAVVCWGSTVQQDIQPRDFLIDADTGQSEPQSVAMEESRYCNVNYVRGIESSSPQFPPIDATTTLIGYVLADPTGILSFIQSTQTQVDNLAMVAAAVAQLTSWRSIVDGALATLRTDLANLAKQLLLYTPLTVFQQLVDLVNELWAYAHRPASYIYYGTDRFLDTSQSNTTGNVDGAYKARVEEGLRFPGGGVGWTGPLALLNPSEPLVQTWGDLYLPKPSGSRIRYDCSFPNLKWTPIRILTFGFWSFNCRLLTPARWRFRCGPPYIPSPPAAIWWYQATLDPVVQILSFDGTWHAETWEVKSWAVVSQHDEDSVYWPRYGQDRWNHYWRDWSSKDYWAKVYNDFPHSGNHCAQTYLNAQDGWLTGITLFHHSPTGWVPPGALTLVISGTLDDGTPDHGNHTLRRVILAPTDVTTCIGAPFIAGDILYQTSFVPQTDPTLQVGSMTPQGEVLSQTLVYTPGQEGFFGPFAVLTTYGIPAYVTPIRINFEPIFLHAGQRVAIHVHSTFEYIFSFVDDDDSPFQVHQGRFWFFDGTKLAMWTSSPRSLRFFAHYATWGRWGQQSSPGGQLSVNVNLQPLQLAGGIGAVDVLANHIIPAACDLHYEVQIGGNWLPFAQDVAFPDGSSALIPFRVVMTGTTDLMPAFSITNSEVSLTQAASNSFHHISTDVVLGSPTTSVKVVLQLQNYIEAHHDCNISLHYGATHNTTPTGGAVDVMQDDGSIMRTAIFTTSSQSDYIIEIDGAWDGTGAPYHVSERITYAT